MAGHRKEACVSADYFDQYLQSLAAPEKGWLRINGNLSL